MNKKTIAIFAVCMVLVAALSVFTTLALLTSKSDTVTNVFTSGNVQIVLEETKIDPTDGVTATEEKISNGINNYTLYPGQDYTKDPTVTVKPSEDAYVGMIVEITGVEGLVAQFSGNGDVANFLQNVLNINLSASWDDITTDLVGGNYVYSFYYKNKVAKSATDTVLDPLFSKFELDDSLTATQLEALKNLRINITAYAVQAQTFDNAQKALYSAFGAEAADGTTLKAAFPDVVVNP